MSQVRNAPAPYTTSRIHTMPCPTCGRQVPELTWCHDWAWQQGRPLLHTPRR